MNAGRPPHLKTPDFCDNHFYMKTGRLCLVVLPIVLAAIASSAGEFPNSWILENTAALRESHAALEGLPMPALSVSNWMNGEVKPEDMKGKVVIVEFYVTWLRPCILTIPFNNQLFEKYKDQGLVLVGVCTSSSGQERMAEMVSKTGMKYPTAMDPDLVSAKAWNVQNYPTYAAIDRKGFVRVIGLETTYVEAVIKKLLAEPVPGLGGQ